MSPEYNFHLRVTAKNSAEATKLQELIQLVRGVEEVRLLSEAPDRPEWLTMKEAASYAKVHPKTIYRWVRSGQLQKHRLGRVGHPRFRREEIDAMFQGNG